MRRENVKNATKSGADFQTEEFAFGYLYRSIEEQLNTFAETAGRKITVADAAFRVGSLLRAKAGGGILDSAEYLSGVRGDAAEGDEVGIAASKVYVRSHGKQSSKRQGGRVNCRECNPPKSFKTRGLMMKHRIKNHPEAMKRQFEAARIAKAKVLKSAA